MNASAYLKELGWRGEGFSLDQSNRGLARPLRVSHKVDLLGLGNKKNDFGNQWWLNAFDKSLDTFGTETPVPAFNPRNIARRTALYSSFVKAETLASTINGTSGLTSLTTENDCHSTKGNSATVSETRGSSKCQNERGSEENVNKTEEKKKHDKKERSKSRDKVRVKKDALKQSEAKSKKTSSRDKVSDDKTNGGVVLPRVSASNLAEGMKSNKKRKHEGERSAAGDLRRSGKKRKTAGDFDKVLSSSGKGANEAVNFKVGHALVSSRSEDSTSADLQGNNELHPESIAAIRARGEKPPFLPGHQMDTTPLGQIVRAYEQQDNRLVREILSEILPAPPRIDQKEVRRQGLPTKMPSETEKYERKAEERKIKREARYWVIVRQNPALYRPNGTEVSRIDDYNPIVELQNKKKKSKKDKITNSMLAPEKKQETYEYKESAAAERQSRYQLHVEEQAEERAAEKLLRFETKHKINDADQKYNAERIRQEKQEKERAKVEEMGISHDDYTAKKKREQDEQRSKRDTARAEELGITLEQLEQQRRKEYATRVTEVKRRRNARQQKEGETIAEADVDEYYDEMLGEICINSALNLMRKDRQQTAKEGTIGSPTPANNLSIGGSASGNSMSLDIPSADTAAIPSFAIDTSGDQALVPAGGNKLVTQMKKAERKTHPEKIRVQRAERNAAKKIKSVNKKQVRNIRTQRKQELLDKLTNEILDRNKREKGIVTTTVKDRNQAKRAAKKLIKDAKKGRSAADGFPSEFYALYGRDKRVKRANHKPTATSVVEYLPSSD